MLKWHILIDAFIVIVVTLVTQEAYSETDLWARDVWDNTPEITC